MNEVKTIYFDDCSLRFATSAPSTADKVCVESECGVLSPAKVVEIIEKSDTLWIISSDVERAYERFVSQMPVVAAAGGVVEDEEGRVMMIYRRGRWDLPKGHVEQGEKLTEAAVREVGEECGLSSLTVGEEVVVTDHFHCAYGRWEVKRTWWYAMRAATADAVPQAEEDITRAEWLTWEQCEEALAESYGTIREVMTKFRAMPER